MIGPIHFTRGGRGFQLFIVWIEDGTRSEIFFCGVTLYPGRDSMIHKECRERCPAYHWCDGARRPAAIGAATPEFFFAKA